MRRPAFAAFALLVGCGGTEVVDYFYGPDDEGVGVPGAEDASADSFDRPDVVVRPGEDAAQGLLDASADGSRDARTEDANYEGGLDADAATPDDASSDAAGDGASNDAGRDASNVDAADASKDVDQPPPACQEGAYRCDAYQQQLCNGGAWQWQVGDQSCCHDPRFTVAGNVVTDGTTGRRWYRFGGRGAGTNEFCAGLVLGGRLPTVDEMQAIIIGPPVNNRSVCSPTVDQLAFQNVLAGDSKANDGCVDLIRAISKAACSNDVGFLCIAD